MQGLLIYLLLITAVTYNSNTFHPSGHKSIWSAYRIITAYYQSLNRIHSCYTVRIKVGGQCVFVYILECQLIFWLLCASVHWHSFPKQSCRTQSRTIFSVHIKRGIFEERHKQTDQKSTTICISKLPIRQHNTPACAMLHSNHHLSTKCLKYNFSHHLQ